MAAYDRLAELKWFDETKAGGINHLPRIFHAPPYLLDDILPPPSNSKIPVIDLQDHQTQHPSNRKEIVAKLKDASQQYGFFQIVNHEIPAKVMEKMKAGVHRFHDQAVEKRKPYYTRDIVAEYSGQVSKLGDVLFELLSEALGLESSYLKDLECGRGLQVVCNYYPACPQPELTLGATKHADKDFITILLQDHIGGLQAHCRGQWVDVPSLPGALVVNIGDFLQVRFSFSFLFQILHFSYNNFGEIDSKSPNPELIFSGCKS
ncbi:1-aminocyclopropane-1-carboxylate oxidase homolog 1 [Linum grandiflorum]